MFALVISGTAILPLNVFAACKLGRIAGVPVRDVEFLVGGSEALPRKR